MQGKQPAGLFALAMSGAVFLSWPFTGLPGLIRTSGFLAAELALSMIVVPLVAIIFAKRESDPISLDTELA